jgi:hypothetical protein
MFENLGIISRASAPIYNKMNFTYNNQKEFETGIPDNLEFSNELENKNFYEEDDAYAQSEMLHRNKG